MVRASFPASGPGLLAVFDRTICSELYQEILKENVRRFVCGVSFKRKWVTEQDVLPKNAQRRIK